MTETGEASARPTDKAGRALYLVAYGLALFGGLVLCGMAAITTISVTTRAAFATPIYGDFEFITIGTGVAVFAFLPLCQLSRENVVVDFFMVGAPDRFKHALDAIGCLIYGLIVVLMSWRTTVGGIGIYENDETTILLAWPLWSTFPLAIFCLVVLALACLHTLAGSVKGMLAGRQG